ncbi:MAG TPA: bifunctional nuclease family protein [bacterium]|nr:bifunctional nuclease family protein [bacterium]HPP30300.1 bifunctional nuclease family protein [bacterium]
MERVEIEGIIFNLIDYSPVVILKSEKGKVLPIVVGIFEAQSILFVIEEASFPRPLTHDLMKNIIQELGWNLLRMEIYTLKKNTYYARLILKKGEEIKEMDCRPSDGIALALRFNAPMFADASLLADIEIVKAYEGKKFFKTNKLDKPITRKEAEEFRKFIENMSAKDFWEKLKKE